MAIIGAALGSESFPDLIAQAKATGAQAVQIFLGDPQSWSAPTGFPAEELKEAMAGAGLALYIHAPYVINVATSNNKVRIPSRKLLGYTMKVAAAAGAAGVVVHGGHVVEGDDPALGYANWAKALTEVNALNLSTPLLIENTAGGERAMARHLNSIAELWKVIAEFNAGFCLDTCHAHAGGLNMESVVADILAITGRIDLVHANGSRDEAGSGRDRHANFGEGLLPGEVVARILHESGAPAIIETPGSNDVQAKDIEFLRNVLVGMA
jgi:deoxyribonuclease-4